MNNKICGCILLLALIGCDEKYTELRNSAKHNGTVIYQDIKQGYFESMMFESVYSSGLDMHFDVLQAHYGQYTPLIGFKMYDQTRKNIISLSYVIEENRQYINLRVGFDNKADLNESMLLPAQITSMHFSWDEENINLKAGTFDHTINIPFTPALIGVTHSSIEIVNNVTLKEKTKNEDEI